MAARTCNVYERTNDLSDAHEQTSELRSCGAHRKVSLHALQSFRVYTVAFDEHVLGRRCQERLQLLYERVAASAILVGAVQLRGVDVHAETVVNLTYVDDADGDGDHPLVLHVDKRPTARQRRVDRQIACCTLCRGD
eukprot:4736431-Prymnesium_polylepis.1